MASFKVILAKDLDEMLLTHTEFIARVSVSAARRFVNEFRETLERLADNPMQFPWHESPQLPEYTYRKALFARWYQAVFSVVDHTVYVDAVVDARREQIK